MSTGWERAPVPDLGKVLNRACWILVGMLLAFLPDAVMQVIDMFN